MKLIKIDDGIKNLFESYLIGHWKKKEEAISLISLWMEIHAKQNFSLLICCNLPTPN